jgi:hypothetical protein
MATTFCGSPAYFAPEVLAYTGAGKPADIYGLGAILYEMLTGNSPYYSNDTEKMMANIQRQEKLAYPRYLSKDAKNILQAVLEKDAHKRPTATALRSHPFFKCIDWDLLLQLKETPPVLGSGWMQLIEKEESGGEEVYPIGKVDKDYSEQVTLEECLLSALSRSDETAVFNANRKIQSLLNWNLIMSTVPVLELIDSFFSYSDEYDHYICEQTAKTSSLGELLEDLETSNITRQRAALNALRSSFLSELATFGPDLRGSETSDYLLSSGALPSLLNYAKLKALEARGIIDQNLDLEQEIRGVCMVLFLTLVLGRKEDVQAEVVGLSGIFEEVCLAFIKLSLEKPFIPMKKVTILLYSYLALILVPHDATQEGHLKLTKGLIQQVTQLPPRFQAPATTSTEAFYVRGHIAQTHDEGKPATTDIGCWIVESDVGGVSWVAIATAGVECGKRVAVTYKVSC